MNDIEDFSLETMLGKMEQMQDQIDKLQQEKAEKDTAILNQKSEMQKLLSKLDELRLTVQQLTAENTQMRSEMQDLLTSNENERKSNENRRHELKQKIERMQNETDHLLKLNKDQKAEVDHANWEIAEKDKKHKATENALENTITKWRTLFCVMSIVSFWLYGIAAHAMGWWAPVEWLIAISVIGIILFGIYNIAQDNPISTMFGLGGFGFLSLLVWLIFR